MNPSTDCRDDRHNEPLPVEQLATAYQRREADQRRTVSVAAHQRFRDSLAGGPPFDPDDDLLEAPPDQPPGTHRRKDRDAKRVLDILDEIAGEEGHP